MGAVPLPVGGRDDSVLTPEEGRKATVRTSLEWPWGAVEMVSGGAESGALPYSFPLQHSVPLLGHSWFCSISVTFPRLSGSAGR